VVVVDCCMFEFGATWREVETESPSCNSIVDEIGSPKS
jgi:hypothetical protein